MNKWFRLASMMLLSFLISCGGNKQLIDEPLAGWDGKKSSLKDLWTDNKWEPEHFSFTAAAKMTQGKSNTSFRLEMRMRKDSLIWLNFSDPILGIPLVRAILTPDSFAMYNKLEKNYTTGDASLIGELLGVAVPFEQLQTALLANFPSVFKLDSVQLKTPNVLALYPNRHALTDGLELQDPMMLAAFWRPSAYAINWEGKDDRLLVKFEQYRQDKYTYPERWELNLLSKTSMRLLLQVNETDTQKQRFPFRIPSNYRKTP